MPAGHCSFPSHIPAGMSPRKRWQLTCWEGKRLAHWITPQKSIDTKKKHIERKHMFQPLGIHLGFFRGSLWPSLGKDVWLKKTGATLGQWNPNGNALFSCLTVDDHLRKVPHSYVCLPKGGSQISELPPPPKKKTSFTHQKMHPIGVQLNIKYKEFHHHNQTKSLVIAGSLR